MNIVCKSPTEKLTEQFWDVDPWDGKMSVLCGLGNAQPGQGRGKWNISTISAQVRLVGKDEFYILHLES